MKVYTFTSNNPNINSLHYYIKDTLYLKLQDPSTYEHIQFTTLDDFEISEISAYYVVDTNNGTYGKYVDIVSNVQGSFIFTKETHISNLHDLIITNDTSKYENVYNNDAGETFRNSKYNKKVKTFTEEITDEGIVDRLLEEIESEKIKTPLDKLFKSLEK
ncbi:hypothetical protein COBT_003068 [Conglomerata obtusa]